jgi:hypothetical protein
MAFLVACCLVVEDQFEWDYEHRLYCVDYDLEKQKYIIYKKAVPSS